MAEGQLDKTEAPTPRRLQEARDEGNVAKSNDLTAACALLVAIILLRMFGLKVLGAMRRGVEITLGNELGANTTRPDDLYALGAWAGRLALEGLAPLVIGVTVAVLLVCVAQVGFLLTLRPLQPKLSKLSPLRGFGNLVNARAGIRLLMNVGKVALIMGVAIFAITLEFDRMLKLSTLSTLSGFGATCELIYGLALKLLILLILLAVGDYVLQRVQRIRELRMSKQEIRDELKRMEGDPLVKQRRSRVARQLAMQRIAQAVPQADVVVTNPTHFAVALKYDSASMSAPRVVAKGADFLAMRIRQLAVANDIPLVERKPLAQALYKHVEVGQEVPPQFYAAVAEILAYVYRLAGRRTA